MRTPSRPAAPALERLFVSSSYLTLLLACACLVWSEVGLLRDIAYFGTTVIILLAVAYVAEGKWALSTWAANALGVAIATLTGLWASQQFRSDPDRLLVNMPWPTSMVPLLGPLLLVLLPAKLFRPKTIPDHWGLQGIGVACVGLGCALADDGIFGLLLLAYLACVVWCLALFFLYRERSVGQEVDPALAPRPRQILAWAVPIVLLALLSFFTMPRSGTIWQLPRQAKKLESGATEESGIDLNRTGTMTLDPEVAFEVFAEDRWGGPKLDLPAEQRWRGPVYRYYYNGSWQRRQQRSDGLGVMGAAAGSRQAIDGSASATLPDFRRDDQYYLNFVVKAKIGQVPFLADPVYRPFPEIIPVVTVRSDGQLRTWRAENESLLRSEESIVPGKTRYRQITVPAPASGLSHEAPLERIPLGVLSQSPALPGLDEWASQLLRRLVNAGRLSSECIEQRDLDGKLNPRHHEAIARALEDYLANSGEYRYSLTLGREDHNVDPTLDFLFNTKSGHCNRFASALAVLLRTLHIHCQVVSGFRGADSRGDGWYDVRQCHAHTWVEAFISREGPRPAHGQHAGRLSWHWLTLDPTPSEAAVEAAAVSERWWEVTLDPMKLYRNLIVNFSPENRDEFFEDLGTTASIVWSLFRHQITARTPEGFRLRLAVGLALLVGAVGSLLAVRWARRRWRRWRGGYVASFPGTVFYRRMLTILARQGWKPAPAQTPREFAESVSGRLMSRPDGGDLAEMVRRTADLYYRVRFGSTPLSVEETRKIGARLDALARRLPLRGN